MKDCAMEIGRSTKTVEWYWGQIKRLTGCQSYVDMVWYALKSGWVSPNGVWQIAFFAMCLFASVVDAAWSGR